MLKRDYRTDPTIASALVEVKAGNLGMLLEKLFEEVPAEALGYAEIEDEPLSEGDPVVVDDEESENES